MRAIARRLVLFGAPLAMAAVVFQHPPDPAHAGSLGDETGLYVGIHVTLLFVLPFLGIAVWLLLDGVHNRAATVARVTLPFALAFYAAFDSLVGIGAGVLAREAQTFSGSEVAGAEALAARWMEIPFPLPLFGALGPLSWTLALLAAAVAHFRVGSSWIIVFGLAIAGPLFGFGHPLITGPIAMLGLIVAAAVREFSVPATVRPTGEPSSWR